VRSSPVQSQDWTERTVRNTAAVLLLPGLPVLGEELMSALSQNPWPNLGRLYNLFIEGALEDLVSAHKENGAAGPGAGLNDDVFTPHQ
jgi:hypothetical protein